MIEDAGLASPSSHISSDPQPRLDYARQLGLKYIVTMLPNPKPISLDDYRAVAANFNRWGASIRDQGMQYVFLSHGHEFLPQKGSTGFDELMKNTDPALVKLEVDIYWLVQTCVDPAAFLSRYRDRIKLLHIKDRTADAPNQPRRRRNRRALHRTRQRQHPVACSSPPSTPSGHSLRLHRSGQNGDACAGERAAKLRLPPQAQPLTGIPTLFPATMLSTRPHPPVSNACTPRRRCGSSDARRSSGYFPSSSPQLHSRATATGRQKTLPRR
jgi:hypothetical protein